jgi:hypothetical protein
MRPAKADPILDPGFQPCNFRNLPFGWRKELMLLAEMGTALNPFRSFALLGISPIRN